MKSKIIKSLVVALFLCATFFVFNKALVHGATRNVLYLEVNEKWSVSMSTNNPVLYKYGDDDKKIVSASISGKKLTIKPIKAGSCTLYICKNGEKKDASIVRTVKVYSYGESSKIVPTLSNNISHNYDGDSYANQSVICYCGRSFTLSISASGIPNTVDANATGGASGYVASSIYECANANGTDKPSSGASWYIKGNALATRSRYYTAGNVNSRMETYVKGCVKWKSSSGNWHWSAYRVIKVIIFPCPYINVYNANGNLINSLNMTIGEPQKLTYDVGNIGAYTFDLVDGGYVISNSSKAEIGESFSGGVEIIPLSKTSIATYLRISLNVHHGSIPNYNGEDYCTFTKTVAINIANLPTPNFIGIINVKNGLRINYDFVKGANSYKIVRASTENGDYQEIGRTTEKYFIDTTASYNVKYYYKICALGIEGDDEEPVESSFSIAKSGYRYVFSPSVDYVKHVGSGLYQIKINSVANYSGYEVYVNGNLQVITNSKYATIKLNTGIYKIKVKAYKTVGKKKVYSNYSKVFKKTINPSKPKVKKIILKGKWIITLKKKKNITGYIIKYSKKKSFNKYKTKKIRKNKFKLIRKYKYIKINAYKKIGNTHLFSKTKKYKLKLKR